MGKEKDTEIRSKERRHGNTNGTKNKNKILNKIHIESLADGLLKKAPSTQIKTWIIIIPVKTVTLRNICVTEV